MKNIVFVAFVSTFLVVVSANECGIKAVNRIVGGINAVENEFPWQVSWRLVNEATGNDQHICGGSLIGKKWVVTAAHCVDINSTINAETPNRFKALLGEHSQSQTSGKEIRLNVVKINQHPNWDSAKIDNDLAVIELERELDLDGSENYLNTICLPSSSHAIEGGNAIISGWGLTEYQGSTLPDILQRAQVPVVTQASCRSTVGIINTITDAMICAGGASGVGVCQGDSGGPLQYVNNGRWHLAGATSWGVGCAWPGFPGVFCRITTFLNYIEQITGVTPP